MGPSVKFVSAIKIKLILIINIDYDPKIKSYVEQI